MKFLSLKIQRLLRATFVANLLTTTVNFSSKIVFLINSTGNGYTATKVMVGLVVSCKPLFFK